MNKSDKDIKYIFLNGGCYFFSTITKHFFPESIIMFNKNQEHCAILYKNKLYDISGIISKNEYLVATEKNLNYFKKYYKPYFIKTEDDFNYFKELFIKEIEKD